MFFIKILKGQGFREILKKPDDPIRAELFGIERLEEHATVLAIAQPVIRAPSQGRPILPRVKENGRVLIDAYRNITQAVRAEYAITSAAEWLIDNFHVVEEQIREILDDLPPNFYRELPKLVEGFQKGYPRVYGIAWAFIAYTDSRLDPEWLRRFVHAYQKKDNLNIGEVFALPISLRIILVENLRRIVEQLIYSKSGRIEADATADSLLGLKGQSPTDSLLTLQPFESAPLEKSFAVQLVLRLRDQSDHVAPALQWLDRRLKIQGTTAEEMVREEHQEQAAINTTIRNIITSMRLISSMDWPSFFEDVSIVDEILRAGSHYAAMDFYTRDLYRHAIEELARGSQLSEVEVAERIIKTSKAASALERSSENISDIGIQRKSDPGYYLISKGRFKFEKEIHCRISFKCKFFRAYVSKATAAYLGATAFATALILAIPLHHSYAQGMSLATLLFFGILALIPASDLSVSLVNRLITKSMGPRPLPKLDFSLGIPADFRTMIVMPTLLVSASALQEHLERLEIHYLTNPEGYLQFALLTDWTDSKEEHAPEDDSLLEIARAGIRKLNDRYGPSKENTTRFFIFHRKRLWNPQENVWMGWERKRGKLHEFNRLLRGNTKTSFILSEKSSAIPSQIRYVITLDADTHMSYGTAYKLAGAMAHPLNRPHFDPLSGRITEGYGVIQPRISPTLPFAGAGSYYQKISSSSSGIDPYAFAVSDVYQDLFKEGSYIGKGIYDVDAFESSLDGRIPENTMLSHDLFEGLYARAALATDIELFEEFPSHYEVAVARTHRWVRGDWQLLPLIGGRKSGADDVGKKSAVPLIGRWKMLDNLRRSLSAPASFLTLLFAWIMPTAVPLIWVNFILITLAIPPLQSLLPALMPWHRQISLRSHFSAIRNDFQSALQHFFLTLIFLAHQSWIMLDAILRTLYRVMLSHQLMLEWTSTAQSKNLSDYHLGAFYKRMSSAPLITLTVLIPVYIFGTPERFWLMIPFALLWIISPWFARRISLPVKETNAAPLPQNDRQLLRLIARKTWRFFETFVTAKHHFLPPDNFQEIPLPVVANRTSPTNIGLYLLAVTAAREFGWIGVSETIERLEATLGTVKKLQLHRGHLLNWYDTHDLRPLEPAYVSTVDSGNLAGHLWTVANTCRQLVSGPFSQSNILAGFEDVYRLIQEAALSISVKRHIETVTNTQLKDTLASIKKSLRKIPLDWGLFLDELEEKSVTLVDIASTLTDNSQNSPQIELLRWSELFLLQIESHIRDLPQENSPENIHASTTQRLTSLADTCDQLVSRMEFGFLFDPLRKIFSIGFQVANQKLDTGYYDCLASEARLASFVAIAKGDVPAIHWFHLGRSLISVDHRLTLVSWSGSMFEYLMPSLVMRSPSDSLLDKTCRYIVKSQIAYGQERHVPWGISESAYNIQNLEMTYQYSNFGVPGLGLRRGLADDLVIAPYATALAAMIDPTAAISNFKELTQTGAEGRYGFYEAIDYTAERLSENKKFSVVQAYMSHHQGMILLSLANVLCDGVMRLRFHDTPRVQAAELLLQERIPRAVILMRVREHEIQPKIREPVVPIVRRFYSPHDSFPRTHLLSNGRYSVMLTAAGSGYSHWRDLAVTRWREDTTRDAWGCYFFLRDVESDEIWSAGYQPTLVEPDSYQVDFSEARAEIIRRDGSIKTTLEVVVSPEDDAEIRRVTIKNMGLLTRIIDVTSYAEIVLASPAADESHPAFSNLFVHTEFVEEINTLICTRRPRAPHEPDVLTAHTIIVKGETVGPTQYESDRANFLGRGRSIRTPRCVMDGKPLSSTVGEVLDPIASLRRRIRIGPGQTAQVTLTTLIATSRKNILELAEKYQDTVMFDRTVTLSWMHAHIQQHHLGMAPGEAQIFQDLAARIIYPHGSLRPSPDILRSNTLGASRLWAHGISGDLPILLLRINEIEDSRIIHEILRAHEYWRMKNLEVDIVILDKKGPSYFQELQDLLEKIRRPHQNHQKNDTPGLRGNIFVLRSDQLSAEEYILIRTAARVTLQSRHGTLAEQLERLESPRNQDIPLFMRRTLKSSQAQEPTPNARLQFFNGLGGFSDDGREYISILGAGQWTPSPWLNVIANPHFGFQVSESGAGYTWAGNSRENKLTPWSNDPVADPSGEIFYIRDEDTGDLWSPTLLPIRSDSSPYTVRHGHGYSQFEHIAHGISSELLQFVPVEDSVKISRLRLTNHSKRQRRISVTAYIEWVLGASRGKSAPFIITNMDEETGAMFARNPFNTDFPGQTVFVDMEGLSSWTADRAEFIGRNATLDHPVAIARKAQLSKKTGAGMDPCAALQKFIELRPGATVEVVFLLGQAANHAAARKLIQCYRDADLNEILQQVKRQWDDILGTIQVRTPDPAMNILLNRWLLYQTLACRLWARCGFYQAGGAYGFRDQLQDVMALTVSRRDLAREHILRAAARQFPEGDVQHWWHPPSGRGVRTRFSDDLIWLPYVVNHYLTVTGDTSILDEIIPYLEGPIVPEGKEDIYFQPDQSKESATLFEHCARTLDRSLRVGSHGLPLMGTGDWNDGMNRVGHEGKGESIWVAWFLHSTLWEFSKIAETRNDCHRAEKWRIHVGDLKAALEHHGWDGEWYRRAYFDDGTPLGSSANKECRIDSIAQTWGVISGAADPARASRAMAAFQEQLVRKSDGLVLLFTPPFNHSQPSPGYIQGYLPGIRENGGQYTHAAAWAIFAYAALGDGNKAEEIFSLLNPIHHGKSRALIHRYKVEPYVMAGDVYGGTAHSGRGGWTWYTGSSGWMYRAGIESILGFRLHAQTLFLDPCIPAAWPGFELSFRYHSSQYEITVKNPNKICRGVQLAEIDGNPFRIAEGIHLADDGQKHQIHLTLG